VIKSSIPENLRTIYVPTGYTARGIAQAELKSPYTWTYWIDEWLMYGDGVVHCAARGAIAGFFEYEDDFTRSPWLAGRFLTRIARKNITRLPKLPEKMVIQIGDQDTANDRVRMPMVRQNVRDILQNMAERGVKYVTVAMPMLFRNCLQRRRQFEDYLLTVLDEFNWTWYYFDDHRDMLFNATNTIDAEPVVYPSHQDTERITEMLVEFLKAPKLESEKPLTINQRRAPYENFFRQATIRERELEERRRLAERCGIRD